ncbi:response regulator transcription factor [Nitrospira sp. Kam-Ns4a]
MTRHGWLKQSGILVFDLRCQLLYSNFEGRLLHGYGKNGDAPVMEHDLAFDIKRLCLRLRKLIGTSPGDAHPDRFETESLTVPVGDVNYRLEGSVLSSELSKEPCILIVVEEEKQRPVPKLNLAHFQATYKLTRREIQILELLSKGASYKEIAYTLSISAHTVRDHIKNIRLKLHAESKCGIMARLIEDAGMYEEARLAGTPNCDGSPAGETRQSEAKPAGVGLGGGPAPGGVGQTSPGLKPKETFAAPSGRTPESRATRGAYARSSRL